MSVKILVVRSIEIFQSEDSKNSSELAKSADDLHTRNFWMYETVSTGWTQGSRVRAKRHANADAVYAYLNKLSAHGWLDDSALLDAWLKTLVVETSTKRRIAQLKNVYMHLL
jgi:hypothetical protein